MRIHELKIFKPDPEDTLGVERKDMPQISERDYPELFAYLEAHGGHVTHERVDPRSLHPIQKEFSDEGVLRTMTSGKLDKPVIASSDDYIIDGHHRWLAAANTHHMLTINRVSLPVTELLRLINQFDKVSYRDIWNDNAAK